MTDRDAELAALRAQIIDAAEGRLARRTHARRGPVVAAADTSANRPLTNPLTRGTTFSRALEPEALADLERRA
jgi:hypothetical protein